MAICAIDALDESVWGNYKDSHLQAFNTVHAKSMHRACIVCDDDATSELRVKTVRYFKGIQETQVRGEDGCGSY